MNEEKSKELPERKSCSLSAFLERNVHIVNRVEAATAPETLSKIKSRYAGQRTIRVSEGGVRENENIKKEIKRDRRVVSYSY